MAVADIMSGALPADVHRNQLRRAIIASTVGTTIEWYDFLLYGIATGPVMTLVVKTASSSPEISRALRDAMKRDRARTKILKISQFGLIEMTRQRIRPSLKRSVYQDCPFCHGMAQVKTCESMSIEVMRMLQLAAGREYIRRIEVRVAADVADYLQNKKRREMARLEEDGNTQIQIRGVQGAPPELLEFMCLDNNGNEVKLLNEPAPAARSRR